MSTSLCYGLRYFVALPQRPAQSDKGKKACTSSRP